MLRVLTGFLIGAASVAVVTTDRGRRFVSDVMDDVEAAARRELSSNSAGRKKKEKKDDAV